MWHVGVAVAGIELHEHVVKLSQSAWDFFLLFVLGNHVGKPCDHVLGDALPPAANMNDISTVNTNLVHPNFCCVHKNLPQVHSVWRKQTVPLLFFVTAFKSEPTATQQTFGDAFFAQRVPGVGHSFAAAYAAHHFVSDPFSCDIAAV